MKIHRKYITLATRWWTYGRYDSWHIAVLRKYECRWLFFRWISYKEVGDLPVWQWAQRVPMGMPALTPEQWKEWGYSE